MLPKSMNNIVEEDKQSLSTNNKHSEIGFRPYQPAKPDISQKVPNVMPSSFSNLSSMTEEPKRKRKRRRMSCEQSLSPETFRKARNKRLAKESRQRKGTYIKTLEQKVFELEDKIINLTEKLEDFKKKVSLLEINDRRGYETLSSAQEYWHDQMSAALKDKSSSKSHLKDIVEYFNSTLGVAGCDRKKVLMNATKVVIENLVPQSIKVLLFCNKHKLVASDKQLETLRTSSKYK